MQRVIAGAAIVMAVALGVGGVLLKHAWSRQAQLETQVMAQKAVIDQKEADAKLNAKVVQDLATKVANTETKVVTVTEKVYVAPKTTVCVEQPSVRIAIDGVRDLYGDSLRAPGGRQPQAPVQTAGPSTGAAKR